MTKTDHLTEADVFKYLRAELATEIATAHAILTEFQGVKELGEVMGLDAMHRKIRQNQILDSRPASPADFFRALKQLQNATHTAEEIELFRQFCAGYGMRFYPLCAAILDAAIVLADSKHKEALTAEAKLSSDVGMKISGSPITAGVSAALSKLRQLKVGCAAFVGHDVQPPRVSALGDLFADEEARVAAEDAAAKNGIAIGPARLLS